MPRSASLRTLAAVGESGQASRNACGVRPVHRRNDRWNAGRFGILEKERDVADAQAAILQQGASRILGARRRGCCEMMRLRRRGGGSGSAG